MKTLAIIILLIGISNAQTIYDVQPGIKGNEIKLTIANISEINPAENVEVKLIKSSLSISFNKETEVIKLIMAKAEAEASFTFDINRNTSVNKKDTIEFMISDANGLMMMKSFIFNHTGPKEFKLEQNFPNPFNPSTTIQYQLPADSRVTLKVYDILGSEVSTLVNEEQEAGYKEILFNATHYASGMYIYRLSAAGGAGNFSSIKKMMLVK